MSARWKISTFVAMGAATLFAIHPVRKTGPITPAAASGLASSTPARTGGIFGFFGSLASEPAAPASHIGSQLEALRKAGSPTRACEALTELENSEAVDEEAVAAIAAVATPENGAATRTCAIHALGRIHSAAATSWLIEMTNDASIDVRSEALKALASKNDPAARDAVINGAHSSDHQTRLAALVAAGEAHLVGASALILEAIQQEHGTDQADLIRALGATHDSAATTALSQLIKDGSTDARWAAIDAMGGVGPSAVTSLEDVLRNGSGHDASHAAAALARIGDPAARALLMDAAKSDRHAVSSSALRELAQLEGDDVKQLMTESLTSTDRQTSTIAAHYFGTHKDASALPTLTALVTHGNAMSASAALGAIASIGGEEAQKTLVEMALRPGMSQGGALQQLAEMPGGDVAARRVALALIKEKGGNSVGTAFGILANDGSPEARDALIDAAARGGDMSAQALSSLAQQGDPAAQKAVANYAQNGATSEIRATAISALSQSNDPKFAPMFSVRV